LYTNSRMGTFAQALNERFGSIRSNEEPVKRATPEHIMQLARILSKRDGSTITKARQDAEQFFSDDKLSGLNPAQKMGIITDCLEETNVQSCVNRETTKVQSSTKRLNELLEDTPGTPRPETPRPETPMTPIPYTYTSGNLKQARENMFGPDPQHSLNRNHPMTFEERRMHNRIQKEAREGLKTRPIGWFSGGYRRTRNRKNRRTNRRKNKSRRA